MDKPSYGNITEKIINIYITHLIRIKKLKPTDIYNKKITSLYYSENIKDKLYFWQLYSLLGEDVITELIYRFYNKVLNDIEHLWFSEEFRKSGSLEYHVIGQKRFWMECMGGGENYKHGKKKLYKKHNKVKKIMNRPGAILWMKFMFSAIDEYDVLKKDKRVIPCIKEFLNFFMRKYAKQFNFKYGSLSKL